MRFGRGVDNRKYKAAGFTYRYTTREAVLKLGEHLRLSPILKGAREPYRYEREVEEFLRWSPSVQGSESPLMRMSAAEIAELQKLLEGIASMQRPAPEPKAAPPTPAPPEPEPLPELGMDDYDELEAEEIIALLGSMERRELEALRELESASRARPSVLHAIDSVLARVPAAG
jgi:UDP-glucose 4-epimerase